METSDELCALLRAKSTTDPARVLALVREREAEIGRLARRRRVVELTVLGFGFASLLVAAIVFARPLVIAAVVLYVVAAIPYALLLIRHERAVEAPAPETPLGDPLAHYRAKLERERGFFPRAGGYVVPLAGSALLAYFGARAFLRTQQVDMEAIDAIFIAVSLPALAMLATGVVVNLRYGRKLGQEIAALEA